jgi:molecular chaperone GrpE
MKPKNTDPEIDSEMESVPEAATDSGTAGAQAAAPAEGESDEAKAKRTWDMLLRTTADFENFKKRAARERTEAARYANVALLEKLIPVLDNFDMALAAAQETKAPSVEALRTGVQMIHQQLRSALVEAGLTEVEATGQPFDPNLHEALSQQESDEVPEGHVLQQVRRGYKLRDRLLRPASVVVAKKPSH